MVSNNDPEDSDSRDSLFSGDFSDLTPDVDEHMLPETNVDHDVDVDMEPASLVAFIAVMLKVITQDKRALYEDIATAGDIANLMASIRHTKGTQDSDLEEEDECNTEEDEDRDLEEHDSEENDGSNMEEEDENGL
ncbi:hypothetical protein BDZ89DRAFT_1061236, partial [Hymenopellis radicata]